MEAGFVRTADVKERAAVHAALGDPARLAIVDALRISDRSPSELMTWLSIDSNLLAYHLDILEQAGLIQRLSSSGDRRRKYLRLVPGRLDAVLTIPAQPLHLTAVLFVCTYNSARSQLAAALWNAMAVGRAESAGTQPAEQVHPLAIATGARHGLDLAGQVPRTLAEVSITPDLLITVCDRANEDLRSVVNAPRLHWSIPDPAEEGTAEAFEQAFDLLNQRITALSDLASVA
jgi:protein-tyrosine-phosphatase/DNA-binding HxlR family transcriptional regulator